MNDKKKQEAMENSFPLKRREAYIDILRILACLMVIFNHTNDRGFLRFLCDKDSSLFLFLWDLSCSTLCKSAVPIFFMISGSMLLGKEESISATFRRIPRILMDLLLFSLFYFWVESRIAGNVFSLSDTLRSIVQGSYWHLWYLDAYLAFLMTLPFFRRLVKGLDVKASFYMFVAAVAVMGVLPIVEYFWIGVNVSLKPSWITHQIFIYPVMGYAVDRVVDMEKVKSRHIGALWIVNIFCLALGGICEYFFLIRQPDDASEMFLTNFCLLNAVAVFLTAKYLFAGRDFGAVPYKVVTEMGKCSFGIYLLHVWFLWKNPVFYNIWMKIEQGFAIGKYARGGVFVSCILVFALAGVCTYILRKIPLVRKLF